MARSRPASLVIACAALAGLPAGAQAAQVGTGYQTTGNLTATWTGPGGVTGSLSFAPSRSGRVSFDTARGGLGSSSFGEGEIPVVRVRRPVPGGPPATCVDLPGSAFFGGGLGLGFDVAGAGRRVRVSVGEEPSGPPADGLSAGRCAGPLAADLAPALPSAALDLARLRRRAVSLDLGGRRPFVAGPFRGEVVSDLRVTLTRARSKPSRRRPPEPVRERGPRSRIAALEVSYRVAAARGELATTYAATGEPDCAPLDACGLTGSSSLSPAGLGGKLVLAAAVPLGGARKAPSAAVLLRRARRGGLALTGFSVLEGPLAAAGATARDGAETCRDEGPRPASIDLAARRQRGARLAFRLGGFGGGPGELLRSRCAGPTGFDVLGRRSLATGTLPLSAVGDPVLRLRLGSEGAFATPGFTGTRRTDVSLELRRTSVRVRRTSGLGFLDSPLGPIR